MVVLKSITLDEYKNWVDGDTPMELTGCGWRLELEPGLPLGDALTSLQCMFSTLLAHENQLFWLDE